jgi:predicted glutamine amidotransferase
VYHSTHPAWNDRNLRELAAGISSPFFCAHIRASTGGAIQETNVHPFRHGRWLWMHNGLIREYHQVKRELQLTFGLGDDPVAAVGRMRRSSGSAA